MEVFELALACVAVLILGGAIVSIILLLIEGALYIWDWKGSRTVTKRQANKRIK